AREAGDARAPRAQAVLVDSFDEPVWREAIARACALSAHAYVVDLAWLRSTPWRERVAAAFDPPRRRGELDALTAVAVRHHPASTVAALLLAGWLASRLGWRVEPLLVHGEALMGKARARRQDVAVRTQPRSEEHTSELQSR